MQFGAVPAKVMLALGKRVVFDDAPEREAQVSVESMSVMVTVVPFKAVSSSVDLSVMSEITGASLTAFTVKTKVSVAVRAVSVAVSVTVALPV